MKRNLFFPFVFFSVLIFSCKSHVREMPAPRLDVKVFFKDGTKSYFRISPDGKYYSFLSNYKDKMNIFVQKVGDTTAVRITNDTLRSIRFYFWKADRLVYQQDIGGDENFQIFSVQADGRGLKCLTPFPGCRSEIIDALYDIPGKDNELIVMINKRNKEYFDPYSLNIKTGELTLLYDNKRNYDSWFTDNNGVIRMTTKTDGVNTTYLYRNSAKDTFNVLLTTSFKETFNPQSFDSANKYIYVLSNIGRDKVSLVLYDPEARKVLKELYATPDYDLNSTFYDRKKKTLVAVYWEAQKEQNHFFDKEWEKLQTDLDKKFPDYQVNIVGYDEARIKGILAISSDRLPVRYYIFNFKNRECTEASNPYPWIKEDEMAPMKPVVYKSRDGLTIHGYLTLPIGICPRNLPVVVNPHGGPWYRDSWGFDPEVQLLANRGYAVLQVNYRGSTGYGKKFWEASFKQWGKKMQDDVTDGVRWLIKDGVADSTRIAIYGGSYGGYCTLAGITFTPNLYKAAVDYVGVSNLFTFLKTIPPYWKPYLDQFHEMVGDPHKDSLLLAEASPALHADRIKAALFIAQGANDPRVNKAESDQMVAALKKRGVTVEYMVKSNEGHGFLNQDNRYDFYGAMDKFLAKYLKPAKQGK